MKPVSGGLLAGGLCRTISGALGGVGQSTYSSDVGLSLTTAATSRVIAWPAGLIIMGANVIYSYLGHRWFTFRRKDRAV